MVIRTYSWQRFAFIQLLGAWHQCCSVLGEINQLNSWELKVACLLFVDDLSAVSDLSVSMPASVFISIVSYPNTQTTLIVYIIAFSIFGWYSDCFAAMCAVMVSYFILFQLECIIFFDYNKLFMVFFIILQRSISLQISLLIGHNMQRSNSQQNSPALLRRC